MNGRKGFTLLELLLATVLSAMLMICVLALVANIMEGRALREKKNIPSENGDVFAMNSFVRLLREDMKNARKVDVSRKNELTLTGYGAMDSRSLRRTHRPVVVHYRFEEIGGVKWLIRRQTAQDVMTNRNVHRDLVCSGIVQFELTGEGGNDSPIQASRKVAVEGGTNSGGAAPSSSNATAARKAEPDLPFEYTEFEQVVDGRKVVRRSYHVQGRSLFLEYIPKWILEEHGVDLSAKDPAALDGKGKDRNDPEKKARRALLDDRDGGTLWRLRVRMDDRDNTVHDRILAVLPGGGK